MKRNYVWNGQTFVDVTGWKRPPSRFPAIHRDTSEPMVHPATGEVFDSKSRFRAVTKQHGLVEVGTDNLTNLNPRRADVKSRKQDIAQAMQMVEQGYQAPPVESLGDADWAGTRMLGGE
jgi:hypothetical protein